MVTSVGAASSSVASNSSAASQSSKSLAQNFDTFLKLLTTQLQHQDPLQPMDSEKSTEQLVSFSGVEQQIAGNKSLESMVALLSAGQSASAANMIGKSIDATGDQVAVKNGTGTWSYELPREAKTATLAVLDSNNNVVYIADADKAAGAHDFTWTGKTNAGTQLPDGTYRLVVTAEDATGTSMDAKLAVRGVVDGVEYVDGATMLTVGSRKVKLADVLSIKATTASN